MGGVEGRRGKMKRAEDVPYVPRVAERERGSEMAAGKMYEEGQAAKVVRQLESFKFHLTF